MFSALTSPAPRGRGPGPPSPPSVPSSALPPLYPHVLSCPAAPCALTGGNAPAPSVGCPRGEAPRGCLAGVPSATPPHAHPPTQLGSASLPPRAGDQAPSGALAMPFLPPRVRGRHRTPLCGTSPGVSTPTGLGLSCRGNKGTAGHARLPGVTTPVLLDCWQQSCVRFAPAISQSACPGTLHGSPSGPLGGSLSWCLHPDHQAHIQDPGCPLPEAMVLWGPLLPIAPLFHRWRCPPCGGISYHMGSNGHPEFNVSQATPGPASSAVSRALAFAILGQGKPAFRILRTEFLELRWLDTNR